MDKSPNAFRTISEVAEELDIPQHVLRFWETRFSQIKPLKRGGGRRFYRPEDVDLLRGIRQLLYGQGYTIRGVQKILKEQGVRVVVGIGRGDGEIPPQQEPADLGDPNRAGDDDSVDSVHSLEEGDRGGQSEPTAEAGHGTDEDDRAAESRAAPAPSPPAIRSGSGGRARGEASVAKHVADRRRGQAAAQSPSAPRAPSSLSSEEVRLLQTTLFELLECKRLLDQAR